MATKLPEILGWILTLAGPTIDDRAEALRRHGLDPASPLDARVRETPESVLAMFRELGGPAPTAHTLTDAERRKLSAAFEALPPRYARVLGERLQGVSFLDGMPNTALTSPVDHDDPHRLYHITIRAGILDETVSEWLTWKERTCFDAEGSTLRLSVEAGSRDALLYVLLHEATHVVDACLGITPGDLKGGEPPTDPFLAGVWADRLTPDPRHREPLLEQTRYRSGGRVQPIDRAAATYEALRRTPFASLYGASNWHDDLAESVALYHLTEILGQPYRIVIRRDDQEVFAYEPTKSDLVRKRFPTLRRFYDQPR